MASWVTRCWSPASVAGVVRPEPDVPEAPLVRARRRLPVARPHFVRDLAGQALLFGEVGTRPEAPPGHRQGRCRSPSPMPGPGGGFLVLEPHADQSLPGAQPAGSNPQTARRRPVARGRPTSRPASTSRPPKYPPIAPAPTTRARVSPFPAKSPTPRRQPITRRFRARARRLGRRRCTR